MRFTEARVVAAVGEQFVYVMLAWASVSDPDTSCRDMNGLFVRLGISSGAKRSKCSLS